MEFVGFDRIGFMAVLLGAVVPALAVQESHGMQEPRGGQAPHESHEQRPMPMRPEEPAHPAAQQGRAEPSRSNAGPQERQQQPERRPPPQAQPQRQASQPPPRWQPGPRGPEAAWQDHRAHDFRSEHRSWQQRGGYHGYRIPAARYRGSFGAAHGFRLSSYPMAMYGGHPRFQYGGFWLSVLDPWPEYWAANWYGNDVVYIGFSGGGYYMYNQSYPGDQIALSISL